MARFNFYFQFHYPMIRSRTNSAEFTMLAGPTSYWLLGYGDSRMCGSIYQQEWSEGNRDACGVFVASVLENEDSKACEFGNILRGGGNNILLFVF